MLSGDAENSTSHQYGLERMPVNKFRLRPVITGDGEDLVSAL
jgi:hypothetical protein